MAKIKQVFAREILDSRGNPTVEVDVILLRRDFRGEKRCQKGMTS